MILAAQSKRTIQAALKKAGHKRKRDDAVLCVWLVGKWMVVLGEGMVMILVRGDW